MKQLRNSLQKIFQNDAAEKESALSQFLRFASFFYQKIIRLRNQLYDWKFFKSRMLPCKVISVGNITVGGTGKTPTVIMIAQFLKNNGFKPAILSRGYGGKTKKIAVVSNGKQIFLDSHTAGDEPALLAKKVPGVPVIIGKNRYLSGIHAIDAFGADVIIMDDAFQHRALFRNIDIVLVDNQKPAGNGFVLPRGTLREAFDGLKRADIIVLTEGAQGETESEMPLEVKPFISNKAVFKGYRTEKDIINSMTEECLTLSFLHGKKIFAFSGIANPEYLKKSLENLSDRAVSFISFPDHHIYTTNDIHDIQHAADAFSADLILTTEKDGVKLIDFPDFFRNIYLIRIEMQCVSHGKAIEHYIMEKLSE